MVVVFAIVVFGTWAVFRFIPRRVRADETATDAEGLLVEAGPPE